MKLRFGLWAVLVISVLLAGCRRDKPLPLNPNEQSAFNPASPEVKQIWDKVLEADKANDYVGAETLLFRLLSIQLTPDQREAVQKESTAMHQRLFAAAAKGDLAAKAALRQLQSNPPNRQR